MSNQQRYEEGNIKTITNDLANGYKALVKGTFQEASEVQNQRRTNHNLRKRWVYTANLPLFRIQEGNFEYGLGGRKVFDAIAGENIDEFTRQILKKGAYTLSEPQKKQLEDLAEEIVWVKAAGLGLTREDDELSYFFIDTADINAINLNKNQKRFAAKVHGSIETRYDIEQELSDYGETLRMLSKEGEYGIEETKLWLPAPAYIKCHLRNGAVVAQASRLYDFVNNYYNSTEDSKDSDFYASRSVCDHGALRGLPVIGEADVQKSETDVVKEAYKTILNNPLTDETAIGLLNYATEYLTGKRKQS
ncbi:hypothetical protein HYT26_04540 [Candidatus Pacearchaeota archaeon]|nr:hypothetical protein [Candidatus Pacearchaeota archaeon]